MKQASIPPDLDDHCAHFALRHRVSQAVHPDDLIFRWLLEHPVFETPRHAVEYYFEDGAKSATLLACLLRDRLGLDTNASFDLLEFAAGYGRVTRHLRNELPHATIVASDIHPQAIEFLSAVLGVPALQSVPDPRTFRVEKPYDVVFALSFFSHVPRHTFGPWIAALFGALRPGGYLVFTTHGLKSRAALGLGDLELPADGFWFRPQSEQGDLEPAEYGTTVVTREFVAEEVSRHVGAQLAVFESAHWWDHQDLYAVGKPMAGVDHHGARPEAPAVDPIRIEPPRLPWTGERYVPELGGNIRLEHVHRYLLARELSAGKRVLDLACGEGYGTALLASSAGEVVGVDNVPEVVAHARTRYPRPNIRFEIGACGAVPLPDASIDLVVSFETLEHVEDQEGMLQEIRRVLRPNGLLLLSTPDRRVYSDLLGNRNPYHPRELDREELEALLGKHFRRVALAGQRVRAGSIVAPLEGEAQTRFTTHLDTSAAGTPGIEQAEYLLALASDENLPLLPTGWLDGGGFSWTGKAADPHHEPHDHGREHALENRIRELEARIGHLEAERDGARALAEQADHRALAAQARIQEVENDRDAARSHAIQVGEQLLEAHARLRDALESWQRQIGESDREAADTRVLEERLTTEWAALQRENSALIAETAALHAANRDLASHEGAVDALRAEISALRAVAADLEARNGIYARSRSWRYTRPIRWLRRDALGLAQGVAAEAARRLRPPPRPTPAPLMLPPPPRVTPPEPVDAFTALKTAPPTQSRIPVIAFYLPQFHPIPENDAWWGKGFTEWTNVTRGKPRFAGHYQPHRPGELGFYDLRILDVQRRQVELAKLYGIQGFCLHHYWFDGTRLLRGPLDQILARPELDLPFCLCWANENWTRRWDGKDDEVLIAQHHSPEDDLAFLRDIEPALRDPRYIRIGDRPLLLVYRPGLLPDPIGTVARWRAYCVEAGLGDPYLVSTQSFQSHDPREYGFDASVEFPPNTVRVREITPSIEDLDPSFVGQVYDYRDVVEAARDRGAERYPLFRCVMPMWDNEPRTQARASIFANSSPELYREWLESACRWTEKHHEPDRRFVFVNAWNEWAEGAHLEPDQRHGYAYLQATADALARFPIVPERPPIVCVSHDALVHGAPMLALALARTLATRLGYDVHVILCGAGPLRSDFEAVATVHDFAAPGVDEHAKLEILRSLHARGARVALCNTSVVGEVVELSKRAGFSVVSMIHELPGAIEQFGLMPSLARVAEHADRVVFPARFVLERTAPLAGISPDRCAVRPQGLLDPSSYFGRRAEARRDLRTQLGLDESARVVLAMGYAEHRKGFDLFVETGLGVAARRTDVVFVWVGEQEPVACGPAIARLHASELEDRFQFLKPLRGIDVFFAGADAYLMTSREDPFPNVVVSALDAEIPVLGFEGGGGFTELLERGCGILVPSGDTVAMSEALLQVLGSAADTERLTNAGREIIARDFSLVSYARDLIELVAPAPPKVSVIVPSFNYARYLPARLRSIIEQTLPPHEILFLDDASSDESVEIARRMLHASGLSHRIITNERNQGTMRQWLRGIREATGDLIWIAEADDDCAPTLLETLVPRFSDPDVVLAYCQSQPIDADGNVLAPDYLSYTSDLSATKWCEPYVRPGVDEIRDTLAVKNTILNVSAVVMRRPDPADIEDSLLRMRNAGDWLFYVHLLSRGSIAFQPEPLNLHRRHSASVTIGGDAIRHMREFLFVQRYVRERFGIAEAAEPLADAACQGTYVHLGLQQTASSSYRDHPALQEIAIDA